MTWSCYQFFLKLLFTFDDIVEDEEYEPASQNLEAYFLPHQMSTTQTVFRQAQEESVNSSVSRIKKLEATRKFGNNQIYFHTWWVSLKASAF